MGKAKERSGTFDALLRDRGLTVYSLAKLSGVAERTIRKICNAKGPIRIGTVRRIAQHVGMEPGEIISILQGDGILVGGATK